MSQKSRVRITELDNCGLKSGKVTPLMPCLLLRFNSNALVYSTIPHMHSGYSLSYQTYLSQYKFFKGPFAASFFLFFVFSIQLTVNKR